MLINANLATRLHLQVTQFFFPPLYSTLVQRLHCIVLSSSNSRIAISFEYSLSLAFSTAGRDFHNFNVLYRECDTCYEVVGFTATQIPNIDGRRYPTELAGARYPEGLPIWPEGDLETIIKEQNIDRCLLAYSDLHSTKVMELGSRCLAAGAEYFLVPPHHTMLPSSKPVIAVCAVRTGCGKSQASRYIVQVLKQHGLKSVVVRHPMPYGNLAEQAVQRFGDYEDLQKHKVTVEEREEYEQHIKVGTIVYAGVDYEAILRQAEKEADVVIWDGGNNDTPFYKPDLWICITDPHRSGNERTYHPGDVNFRCADALVNFSKLLFSLLHQHPLPPSLT